MDSRTAQKLKLALTLVAIAYVGLNVYNMQIEEEKKEKKRKARKEIIKRKYKRARKRSSSSDDDNDCQPRQRPCFRKQAKVEQQANNDNLSMPSDNEPYLKVSHIRPSIEDTPSEFVDLVSKYSDEMFKEVFHISQKTADRLCVQFELSTEYKNIFKLNDQTIIPAKHYIWMFLWFVARKCSYLELSTIFNVSLSKSLCVVDSVLQFLSNCARDSIQLPETNEDLRSSAENFEEIADFPDVIACLISNQFQTKAFKTPLSVQVLCDSKGRFLDVYVDFRSNIHATEVLAKNPIIFKLKTICQVKYHVLAKQDYFLRQWMLTPIDEPKNKEHIWYNRQHAKTMNVVLNSLEILTQRFPQLTAMQFLSLNKARRMINACCVLQNMCFEEEDFFDVEIDSSLMPLSAGKDDEGQTGCKPLDIDANQWNIGDLKRKKIACELKLLELRMNATKT